MKALFKKVNKIIIDILFPIKCISCNIEGSWLCQKCNTSIKLINEHHCPVCEKVLTPSGLTCTKCRRSSTIDGLIVATSYKNRIISKCIHYYKYRFIDDLHVNLAALMVNSLRESELPLVDFIIPIPLHKRRLRWRGFNQSELLASYLSKNLTPGFEINNSCDILIRKKYTQPQMAIKKCKERKENIRDAFIVTQSIKIKNSSILLVDDVATTGSTLFECAKVLKKAGAKSVYAIVIARQESNNFLKH